MGKGVADTSIIEDLRRAEECQREGREVAQRLEGEVVKLLMANKCKEQRSE